MMARFSLRTAAVLLAVLLVLALAVGLVMVALDDDAPDPPAADRPQLGLMTGLPLYWPLGANIAAITSGDAPMPWQRAVFEQRYQLVLLDTLSPIAGLGPQDGETDPLAGLSRLAIIQPRGLAPADNVALDDWVRGGGRLLLVLDPMLTGEYDLPLGDPRRPSDTALIPPVVARWGMEIVFDEDQDEDLRTVPFGSDRIALALAGEVRLGGELAQENCRIEAAGAAALCRIGEGRALVVADAAMFEHREAAGRRGERIKALFAAAFE
ncbi:MAG: hypothetical protein ACXIT4_12960 [Erythrobacter sp.]